MISPPQGPSMFAWPGTVSAKTCTIEVLLHLSFEIYPVVRDLGNVFSVWRTLP